MNATETKAVARTQGDNAHAEPVVMRKQIGSTTFLVVAHFSERGETIENKILRLVEREVESIA